MTGPPIRVLELRSVRGTGGGPEKTILQGAACTDPARYAVTVCYIRDLRDGVFHIDARASGLPIDYVEVHERHSFDARVWTALRRLVRERQIDIVHAHDYKTDLLALGLARAERIAAVATAHGWSGHGWRERRVYYPADRWLLARYPRVVAVSSEIRNVLLRAGASAERLVVLLNGIDPEAYRPEPEARAAARDALGIASDDVVIGAVGRLEQEKNFDLLLRAFTGVAARYPRARLVIGGDGSGRALLERRAAELGFDGRCRFLGHVQNVAGLHQALDLFVQSSDHEGTPNAVLEAMACGTPIVATNAGGTADLARPDRDAVIVPIKDVEALAAGIDRALADEHATRERAQSARRRIETDLSFAARVRRLEALYDEMLTNRMGHA